MTFLEIIMNKPERKEAYEFGKRCAYTAWSLMRKGEVAKFNKYGSWKERAYAYGFNGMMNHLNG